MVKMTRVWDRTTEFLGEHGRGVFVIAAPLVFLPNLLSTLVDASRAGSVPTALTMVVQILALVVPLLGGAAMTWMAIHPSGPGPAIGHAARRLPPIIGVSIVLLVGCLVLAIPFGLILASTGVDLSALSTPGASMPDMSGGIALALMGYALFFVVLVFWLTARLAVVGSVILAERRGLGAITRSWELTRGHGLRIMGLLLLFIVVSGIAMGAVGAAVGAIALIFTGADSGIGIGTIVIASAAAIVATLLTVVQSVFVGKLYTLLAPAPELEATFA